MTCPWEVFREAERRKIRLALAAVDEIKRKARYKASAGTRQGLLSFVNSKDFAELCDMAILEVHEERPALRQLLRRADLVCKRVGVRE